MHFAVFFFGLVCYTRCAVLLIEENSQQKFLVVAVLYAKLMPFGKGVKTETFLRPPSRT